jgi:hypothetical protein
MTENESAPAFEDTQPMAPAGSDISQAPPFEETTDANSIGEQAKALLHSTESGFTLGGSDVAQKYLLPKILPESLRTTPEELASEQKQFPITSLAGNMIGSTGLIAATGGLGAVAKAGQTVGLAAKALGLGNLAEKAVIAGKVAAGLGEGAILSAGNVASEAALGDPDMNMQKALSHIGWGTLIGGSIPIVGKGLSNVWGKFKSLGNFATDTEAQAAKLGSPGSTETTEGVPIPPVAEAPRAAGIQPTTIEDIQAKVNAAKTDGISLELPQKAELLDAVSRVPMKYPVNPLQLESLSDQTSRNAYNVAKEIGGKEGEALNAYEQLQKIDDLIPQTEKTIQSLAPEAELTPDAYKGGTRANEIFTDKYQSLKNEEGPKIGTFRALSGEGFDHQVGVVNALSEKLPGLSQMFDSNGEKLAIRPYSTSMSITHGTYSAVKEAFNSLEENPQKFDSLFNIRDGLSEHVNLLTSGKTQSQIMALKSGFMDYMQNMIDKSGLPELRDTMRKYAINEAQKGVIEKNFGASVGAPEFGQISKIKPENIGDNIFRNTATTQAAKNILGDKEFGEILGNWLTENKAKVTDKGAFSSNKWASFLKRNQDSLNIAFKDKPEMLQALRDHATIMRILPDAPSINPSGTAKTLLGIVKGLKGKGVGELAMAGAEYLGEHTIGKIQKQVDLANLNNKLAGRAGNDSVINGIKKIADKATDKISSAASSVFESPLSKAASVAIIGTSMKAAELKAMDDRAKELENNPDAIHQQISQMNNYAPAHAAALAKTIAAGVSYINSQRPSPNQVSPLDKPVPVSRATQEVFNRKLQIVNNPMLAIQHLKDGTLQSQDVQAIQAVYPALYTHVVQQLETQMMENAQKDKAIPYSVRVGLSTFMGYPVDSTMSFPSVSSIMQANSGQQVTPPAGTPRQRSHGATQGAIRELSKGAQAYATPSQSRQLDKLS